MKYKCFIFDLDGTLIESLKGILDAINKTFEECGLKIHRNIDEAKYFIGAGVVEFGRRAMAGHKIPVDKEKEIIERFLINYSNYQKTETKVFPGIDKMLVKLKEEGGHICIASNKPQILLDPIVKQLFPNIEFDIALGQRKNVPVKPDPFVIFEIIKELKINLEECVYIGDSEYDYLTAHNAGIDCVICKYGYGFYDEDFVKKSKYVVNTVKELEKKLLN